MPQHEAARVSTGDGISVRTLNFLPPVIESQAPLCDFKWTFLVCEAHQAVFGTEVFFLKKKKITKILGSQGKSHKSKEYVLCLNCEIYCEITSLS